jgi:hypothetical protein
MDSSEIRVASAHAVIRAEVMHTRAAQAMAEARGLRARTRRNRRRAQVRLDPAR